MSTMPSRRKKSDSTGDQQRLVELAPDGETSVVQPWELVEAGRYMPRRIRGSLRGRVLG
jgi:hypothetical protein